MVQNVLFKAYLHPTMGAPARRLLVWPGTCWCLGLVSLCRVVGALATALEMARAPQDGHTGGALNLPPNMAQPATVISLGQKTHALQGTWWLWGFSMGPEEPLFSPCPHLVHLLIIGICLLW